MDDIVLIACVVMSAWLWFLWYGSALSQLTTSIRPVRYYWFALLLPPLCAQAIWFVLRYFAASDVVNAPYYLMEYFFMGLLWVALAERLFHFLGISFPLDVFENRNPAALIALTGALLGVTFCFSGGNIGEGPGFQVVVFSSGLATLIWFGLWWLLSIITQNDYTVTIDRDLAGGIRLGGYLAASGLILGRAAAGNWVSAAATLSDMLVYGSPVLLLFLVAVLLEFLAKPTVENPTPLPVLYGLVPTLLFFTGAIAYLIFGIFPV